MPRRRISRRQRSTGPVQQPFAEICYPRQPVKLISADQVETIHHASLKILRDIGLKVDSALGRKLPAEIGADVDDDDHRTRFDPALVEEMLTGIPSDFTIHARNPEKTVHVGGNALTFATVGGPSFS